METIKQILATITDPKGILGLNQAVFQNVISDIISFFVFQMLVIFSFLKLWNRKTTSALRQQREWILVEIRDTIARVAIEEERIDRAHLIKSLRSRLTLFDHSVPVEGWTSTSRLLDYLEKMGADGLSLYEFAEIQSKFENVLRDFSVSGADVRRHNFFLNRLSKRLYQ